MAEAEFHETLKVDREKLFKVITKYEDYPQFVDGCKSAKPEKKGEGQTRVTYHVSMMKDVHYTLDHHEDQAAGRIGWQLVESDSFKKNAGHWELKAAGPGKTEIRYVIEIEFKFPVPGLILNRLVKGSLPAMVQSFVKRANSI